MTATGAEGIESPIRVLLASPLPPPPGGIAGWTERMLAHPRPADIRLDHVDVATHLLHHYRAPVGPARVTAQGRVVARFLWRLVRTRPHLVHLTTSYDTAFLRDVVFLAAARLRRTAMILNIRGGDFDRFVEQQSPRMRARIDAVLGSCAAIVAVTHATEAYLRARGLERTLTIPNCIDLRAAPARPGGTRWLFVGWVMRAKGILELLSALSEVPAATLTVAGPAVTQDGVDGNRLVEEECRRLKIMHRVHRVAGGSHEVVRALYREHDVFVFPSHREGFPNVVLEAMEAGLPVVASTVGAIGEMIRDGREGFLVAPGSPDALAAALRRYVAEPSLAARHGAAARARVEAAFTVERVAQQWYSLYRRVGSPPPGPDGGNARPDRPRPEMGDR